MLSQEKFSLVQRRNVTILNVIFLAGDGCEDGVGLAVVRFLLLALHFDEVRI